MKLTDYEIDRLNDIGRKIQTEQWSNIALVQLIELSGGFLNLKTIPDYAKENNMSYNGVKKFRKIETIFGVKFVIDNK